MAGGRRSTRSARGSAKRRRNEGPRGGGGGLKRRFERAAERPAKKWVRVFRTPAPRIQLKVATWVPYSDLTEQERLDYDAKLQEELERRKQQQREDERQQQQQQLGEETSKKQGLEEEERNENNDSKGATTSIPMELEGSKDEDLSKSNDPRNSGESTVTPQLDGSTPATIQTDSTVKPEPSKPAEDCSAGPPAKRSRVEIDENASSQQDQQ